MGSAQEISVINTQDTIPAQVGKETPSKDDDGNEVNADEVKSPTLELFWIAEFKKMCRCLLVQQSMISLLRLMKYYTRHVGLNVNECYTKPFRAAKLKDFIGETLLFFLYCYRELSEVCDRTVYLDKMSDLLAMYVDMELKASKRGKEQYSKITARLTSCLYVYLENSTEHLLDTLIKIRFMNHNYHVILDPIITKIFKSVPTRPDSDVMYVRYFLAYCLWKKVNIDAAVKDQINVTATSSLGPLPTTLPPFLMKYVLPKVPKSQTNSTKFLLLHKFDVEKSCKCFVQFCRDSRRSGEEEEENKNTSFISRASDSNDLKMLQDNGMCRNNIHIDNSIDLLVSEKSRQNESTSLIVSSVSAISVKQTRTGSLIQVPSNETNRTAISKTFKSTKVLSRRKPKKTSEIVFIDLTTDEATEKVIKRKRKRPAWLKEAKKRIKVKSVKTSTKKEKRKQVIVNGSSTLNSVTTCTYRSDGRFTYQSLAIRENSKLSSKSNVCITSNSQTDESKPEASDCNVGVTKTMDNVASTIIPIATSTKDNTYSNDTKVPEDKFLLTNVQSFNSLSDSTTRAISKVSNALVNISTNYDSDSALEVNNDENVNGLITPIDVRDKKLNRNCIKSSISDKCKVMEDCIKLDRTANDTNAVSDGVGRLLNVNNTNRTLTERSIVTTISTECDFKNDSENYTSNDVNVIVDKLPGTLEDQALTRGIKIVHNTELLSDEDKSTKPSILNKKSADGPDECLSIYSNATLKRKSKSLHETPSRETGNPECKIEQTLPCRETDDRTQSAIVLSPKRHELLTNVLSENSANFDLSKSDNYTVKENTEVDLGVRNKLTNDGNESTKILTENFDIKMNEVKKDNQRMQIGDSPCRLKVRANGKNEKRTRGTTESKKIVKSTYKKSCDTATIKNHRIRDDFNRAVQFDKQDQILEEDGLGPERNSLENTDNNRHIDNNVYKFFKENNYYSNGENVYAIQNAEYQENIDGLSLLASVSQQVLDLRASPKVTRTDQILTDDAIKVTDYVSEEKLLANQNVADNADNSDSSNAALELNNDLITDINGIIGIYPENDLDKVAFQVEITSTDCTSRDNAENESLSIVPIIVETTVGLDTSMLHSNLMENGTQVVKEDMNVILNGETVVLLQKSPNSNVYVINKALDNKGDYNSEEETSGIKDNGKGMEHSKAESFTSELFDASIHAPSTFDLPQYNRELIYKESNSSLEKNKIINDELEGESDVENYYGNSMYIAKYKSQGNKMDSHEAEQKFIKNDNHGSNTMPKLRYTSGSLTDVNAIKESPPIVQYTDTSHDIQYPTGQSSCQEAHYPRSIDVGKVSNDKQKVISSTNFTCKETIKQQLNAYGNIIPNHTSSNCGIQGYSVLHSNPRDCIDSQHSLHISSSHPTTLPSVYGTVSASTDLYIPCHKHCTPVPCSLQANPSAPVRALANSPSTHERSHCSCLNCTYGVITYCRQCVHSVAETRSSYIQDNPCCLSTRSSEQISPVEVEDRKSEAMLAKLYDDQLLHNLEQSVLDNKPLENVSIKCKSEIKYREELDNKLPLKKRFKAHTMMFMTCDPTPIKVEKSENYPATPMVSIADLELQSALQSRNSSRDFKPTFDTATKIKDELHIHNCHSPEMIRSCYRKEGSHVPNGRNKHVNKGTRKYEHQCWQTNSQSGNATVYHQACNQRVFKTPAQCKEIPVLSSPSLKRLATASISETKSQKKVKKTQSSTRQTRSSKRNIPKVNYSCPDVDHEWNPSARATRTKYLRRYKKTRLISDDRIQRENTLNVVITTITAIIGTVSLVTFARSVVFAFV